jgi:hypothetical protein
MPSVLSTPISDSKHCEETLAVNINWQSWALNQDFFNCFGVMNCLSQNTVNRFCVFRSLRRHGTLSGRLSSYEIYWRRLWFWQFIFPHKNNFSPTFHRWFSLNCVSILLQDILVEATRDEFNSI